MAAPAPLRRSRSSASKPIGHRSRINLGAEHENLDQKAYHILKFMIMDRQLLPGEKIPQEKLAEDLGISRTPLINALKFLEKEKLVRSVPRRGFYMRTFTPKEMLSIFELREVLEGLAARKAAEKITDNQIVRLTQFFKQFTGDRHIDDIRAYAREDRRFHNFLLDIGAKEFLKSILETYNIISYSYQVVAPEGLVRAPRETIHEHRAIIEAIAKRNAEAAENLMRRHFQRSRAVLQASLKADD
jgi:DNA-binding GntR family transcriptional regulator